MPPDQCPACGRFLKRSFVLDLADGVRPCPRCGVELDADAVAPTGSAHRGPGASPGDASVRPPDLRPAEVRGHDDPLAGWDAGVPMGISAVTDRRPFPVDTVVVVGAMAAGLTVGSCLGDRRVRNAVLGALGGAVGAGLGRRLWRAP